MAGGDRRRAAGRSLSAGFVPAERAELWTVTLSNDGSVDAALPRQVRLDPACEVADGANGFRLTAAACRRAAGSRGDRRWPAACQPQTHHRLGAVREPGRMLDVVQ